MTIFIVSATGTEEPTTELRNRCLTDFDAVRTTVAKECAELIAPATAVTFTIAIGIDAAAKSVGLAEWAASGICLDLGGIVAASSAGREQQSEKNDGFISHLKVSRRL